MSMAVVMPTDKEVLVQQEHQIHFTEASYFDGFDFENAKPIKHPLIEQAQARAKMAQEQEQNELISFCLKTPFTTG